MDGLQVPDVRSPTANDVYVAVVSTMRPLMLERGFDKTSCVAATRIVLDVCAAVGIHARPIPVRLEVFNAEMWTLLEEGNAAIKAAVSTGPHMKDSEGGPWMIDINSPSEMSPVGAGHVVAALRDESDDWFLLDSSVDQVTRRHKKIVIEEPLLIPIASTFLKSLGAQVAGVHTDGVRIVYTRVRDRRYRDSPNWRRRSANWEAGPVFDEITKETVEKVRTIVSH